MSITNSTAPGLAPYDCADFDARIYWADPAAFGDVYPCPIQGWQIYHFLWIVGGICAALGASIVCLIIYKHLEHYTDPRIQKFLVRILWMIPIYAINSFLSAVFRKYTLYVDVARDCYEAYVLFNFFKLLVELGGGEEKLVNQLERVPRISYPQPFCNFKLKPNKIFFHRCRQMILQFVWVKLFMTALIFLLQFTGKYGEGSFNPKKGYLYITVFYNISITVALYFMLFFYEATKEILHEFKPMSKFLCVKAVLFFSFWQSIALAVLTHFGVIGPVADISPSEFASMLQDVLVCVEMLPAGIAFAWTFGYSSFRDKPSIMSPNEEERPKSRKMLANFAHMASPIDVLHETGAAISKPKKKQLFMGDFWNLPMEQQFQLIKKMGWLKKLGEDVVNWWQDRYCVIIQEPRGLLIFKGNPFDVENSKLKEPQAFIDFVDVEDAIPNETKRKTRFDIHTAERVWRFDAPSESERDIWMKTIVSMLPYGQQPLTIAPEDETVGSAIYSPKPPPRAASPTPSSSASLLAEAPKPAEAPMSAVPASVTGNPPKRTRSLTFEVRDNDSESVDLSDALSEDAHTIPLEAHDRVPLTSQPSKLADDEVDLNEIL